MNEEDFQDRVQQKQSASGAYGRLGQARLDPGLAAAIGQQRFVTGLPMQSNHENRESAVAVEVVGSEQVVASLLAALSVLEQKLAPILAPLPPTATGGGRGEAPRAPRSPLAEQLQATRQRLHMAEAKVQELIDRIEV